MRTLERPRPGAATAIIPATRRDVDRFYTASQWRLIWWRFRRHRAALFGMLILGLFALSGLFANFIAPYPGDARDTNYLLGPPQVVRLWDSQGLSRRPFVHEFSTERDPVTLRQLLIEDPDTRRPLRFLVRGEEWSFYGLFSTDLHLFGVKDGSIHLFGTDELGRDLFSRAMIATRTSLSIGILGVMIAFILALIIGGISGYAGGWLDYGIQRFTEIVRVVPVIPLFIGLAAAFPQDWSSTRVYFMLTLILSLVGWPTLARRVRSQLLALGNEDYVVAAHLAGAGPARIIARHMLPAFTSYIIVDLVISFPYMILSETALSFIGLGLRPPAISWGVLLQEAQNIRAIQQAPWLFIPAIYVIVAVLAFTVIGDGMRDAADPYVTTSR